MQALALVLRHTWPRVPAHAQLVWDHLAEEYRATAACTPQLHRSRDECKDSSSEAHHNSSQILEGGIGRTGRLDNSSTKSMEEVHAEIVRAAEVLWRAGGEAFQEHMQKAPDNQSALLQRIMSVQND